MERCNTESVQEMLLDIYTRNFSVGEFSDDCYSPRMVHYGMLKKNPMTMVKFFDKTGKIQPIESDILASMCPTRFYMMM